MRPITFNRVDFPDPEGPITDMNLPSCIVTFKFSITGITVSPWEYDFEIFSPAQEKWLEVSSVSNFETFQSKKDTLFK